MALLEMQRLANGFKLQQSTGKNLQASIDHFDRTISSKSGQKFLRDWVTSMDDTERRASFTGENALMRPPEQSGLPVPNDEQARLGQAALHRDRVALIALKEAFATHALPYDLSESATT